MLSLSDEIAQNEKSLSGVSYVFRPSKIVSRKLVVCFGAMGKGGYSRVSWYLQEKGDSRDNYLFLRDPTESYYCGTAGAELFETYRAIIEEAIEQSGVSRRNVITVGNSMGGTAAIMFSALLGLGCAMATNPQIDFASAAMSKWGWLSRMRSAAPPFMEINKLLSSSKHLPVIHAYVTSEAPDVAAVKVLTNCMEEVGGTLMVHKQDDQEHKTSAPSALDIEKVAFGLGMHN
jgi:hypothetical protein